MIWFTSDLHLGHANVIRFCARPFANAHEMDKELVRRWNAVVKPDDKVYVLGDLSFHNPKVGIPLIRQLQGHKVLVQGNHDKYSRTQYLAAGFEDVVQEMTLKLFNRDIILSHYPKHLGKETEKIDLRFMDRRPTPKWGHQWVLCGHVHEKWMLRDRELNVGVDQHNFAPISMTRVEQLIALEEIRLSSEKVVCLASKTD